MSKKKKTKINRKIKKRPRKLQPLRPTTTQMTRLQKGEQGDGFFIYLMDKEEGVVEVVEFKVDEEGIMRNMDDTVLRYSFVGSNDKPVYFKVIPSKMNPEDI